MHSTAPSVHDLAPQRLLLLGATGSVGRTILQQALNAGHRVTAFCRAASRIEMEHPRLRVVAGNVFEPQDVGDAVAGHDAVLVALGGGVLDRSGVRHLGTANVIAGMRKHGVHRLLCVSILGNAESWNNLPWSYKVFVKPLVLRRAYADHALQEKAIRASDLDWTIVRPPSFTDGPATGAYQHGFAHTARALRLRISRADLAGFMLGELRERQYIRACPGISY